MSLLIYKPPHTAIPENLIRAISSRNPDAWGLMGISEDHRLILRRSHRVDVDDLLTLTHELRTAEYVLHLHQRTSEGLRRCNVYPFMIGAGLYLMHSGMLDLKTRVPGKSDTWHLVHKLLLPLTVHWYSLFVEPSLPPLRALLENKIGPENHVVLLDHPRRQIIVINRGRGIEVEGLWLSNALGIDTKLFSGRIALLKENYRILDARFLCT
jgi:hypothetical protein